MRNKMDEMDRQIQLLSEERGYRVIVLALALWVLYNCWQAFFRGGLRYGQRNPGPGYWLAAGSRRSDRTGRRALRPGTRGGRIEP